MKFYFLILFSIFSVFCFGQKSKTSYITGTVKEINTEYPKKIFFIHLNDSIRFISRMNDTFKSLFPIKKGNYNLKIFYGKNELYDTNIIVDKDHQHFDFELIIPCLYYNKTKAIKDLEKDSAVLYLSTGLDSITYPSDIDFKTNYNISYYNFGCIIPQESCVKEYNQIIFDYLDKKYGEI